MVDWDWEREKIGDRVDHGETRAENWDDVDAGGRDGLDWELVPEGRVVLSRSQLHFLEYMFMKSSCFFQIDEWDANLIRNAMTLYTHSLSIHICKHSCKRLASHNCSDFLNQKPEIPSIDVGGAELADLGFNAGVGGYVNVGGEARGHFDQSGSCGVIEGGQ
jgi:hypothetical protein